MKYLRGDDASAHSNKEKEWPQIDIDEYFPQEFTSKKNSVPTAPFYRSPIAVMGIIILIPNLLIWAGHYIYLLMVKGNPDFYFDRCKKYITSDAFYMVLNNSSLFNVILLYPTSLFIIIFWFVVLYLRSYKRNWFYNKKREKNLESFVGIEITLTLIQQIQIIGKSPYPIVVFVPIIGYILAMILYFKASNGHKVVVLSFISSKIFSILLSFIFYLPYSFKTMLSGSVKLDQLQGVEVPRFKENLEMFCEKYDFPIDDIIFGSSSSFGNHTGAIFGKYYIYLESNLVQDLGADTGIGVFLHELKHVLNKDCHINIAIGVALIIVQIALFLIFRRKGATSIAFVDNCLLVCASVHIPACLLANTFLCAFVHKRRERDCDNFAHENGYADAFARLFENYALNGRVPIYVLDSPWYVNMFQAHPTFLERIRALKS